jgi:hypothetical protein
MSEQNEYLISVEDESGLRSRVVVHARDDQEASEAAERVTGSRFVAIRGRASASRPARWGK